MAKVEINMPRFGAQMKEGKILKWLVAVGDKVSEDDALLEVKAEKMDAEVESLYDGKIVEIIAKDGDVVVAPFDQEGVKERFEFVEGECEIVPGISVYESFGHCPGHQTIVVQTKNGPYYCVGDSVFVMGNIDTTPEVEANLHYDILPPGRYVDIVASWLTIRDTLRRCKEAGVDPHKHLLLAHDYGLFNYCDEYEKENGKLPVFGE